MNNLKETQIDFAKYRTPELFAAVSDLVSIPGGIRLVTGFVFLSVVLLASATGLVLVATSDELKLVWFLPVLIYTVPAGFLAGLMLGLVELIRQSIGNMLKIVDVLLELTCRISTDVSSMATGEKQLPPPGELVRQVHCEVIVPTIEQVIADQFGIIARPLLWFYRMTLGRLVKIVIARFIPVEKLAGLTGAGKTAEQDHAAIKQGMQKIADNEEKIVTVLGSARRKIETAGGWLKLMVMLPGYAFCLIQLLLIMTPIVLVWLFLVWEST